MAPRIAYVAFETGRPAAAVVAAKLVLPAREAAPSSLACVLICHGSDGVDGRGEFHAAALHAAGIATLEIDMWSARGATRGAAARPGSPLDTLPDAFALQFLGRQPEIDPRKIGVMGFSWGGVVALVSATDERSRTLRGEAPAFAAHAAFYPVCWAYRRLQALSLAGLTGAPILIQTGEADGYDPPGAAAALVSALRAEGAARIEWLSYRGRTMDSTAIFHPRRSRIPSLTAAREGRSS
jgi:dienelactone hydrolase